MQKIADRAKLMRRLQHGAALLPGLMVAAIPLPAHSQQLITNGGFESGTFTGWTLDNAAGSTAPGGYVLGNNSIDNTLTPPSPSTPTEHFPSVGAKSGSFYAVSDSAEPGAHALLQNFTVAPNPKTVVLSFDMFVNDWNGGGAMNATDIFDPNQVDRLGNVVATQFASVDLLAGSALNLTSDVGLLDNLYVGEDGFTSTGLPNPYQHFTFDITNFVQSGGDYRIRFGEVDNQFTLNQGVDNVSVFETQQPSGVPEPGAAAVPVLGCCFSAWAYVRRAKGRRANSSKQSA